MNPNGPGDTRGNGLGGETPVSKAEEGDSVFVRQKWKDLLREEASIDSLLTKHGCSFLLSSKSAEIYIFFVFTVPE